MQVVKCVKNSSKITVLLSSLGSQLPEHRLLFAQLDVVAVGMAKVHRTKGNNSQEKIIYCDVGSK